MNDKIKHIIAGAIIAIPTYFLAQHFLNFNEENSAVAGIAMAGLGGLAKEIYDMYKPKPTGFDKYDILATVIGGAFASVALIIIT